MTAGLDVEREGSVVWCALARPPLNLLEPRLIRTLRATFEALARDPSVRVAVLTGAGRAFTAGMDVRVLRDLTPRARNGSSPRSIGRSRPSITRRSR